MHPTATTACGRSRSSADCRAARIVSMDSFLAASMNPQVFTRTASASSASATSVQPSPARRPASSSESTSLRAHPKVTIATRRCCVVDCSGTGSAYGLNAAQLAGPATIIRNDLLGILTHDFGDHPQVPDHIGVTAGDLEILRLDRLDDHRP